MNPDSPTDSREALEANLTALLLGELPHEEAAALHQKLAQDAELAKLYERLKSTINLVRETVASPATQAPEPLIPLRLEEHRRQKLLQHFKTVAPREFVQPRRRATRWLVPVSIAAAFVVILGALFLPALSKSKSSSHSLAFGTWSISKQDESALSQRVEAYTKRTDYYADLNRNGRAERYGLEGQKMFKAKPLAPPPQAAPPAAKPASPAIVLPKATEVATLTVAPSDTESVQAGFAVSGTARGYYDDSLGRAGGVGGGGGFGGYKGSAPGGASAAGGRQTEVAGVDYSFGESAARGVEKAGKVANRLEQARVLNESSQSAAVAATPAPSLGLGFTPSARPAAPAAVPEPVTSAPAEDSVGKVTSRVTALGGFYDVQGKDYPLSGSFQAAPMPLETHNLELAAGDLVTGGRGRVAGLQPTEALNKADLFRRGDLARADTGKQAAYAPAAGDSLTFGTGLKGTKEGKEKIVLPGSVAAGQPAPQEQFLGRALTPDQVGAGQLALNSAGAFNYGLATTPADGRKDQWYFDSAAHPEVANVDGDKVPILGDAPDAARFYRVQSEAKAGADKGEGKTKDDVAAGAMRAKVEERAKVVELADKLDTVAAGVEQRLSDGKATTQKYFAAKRELDELQRSRQALGAKTASEGVDLYLPQTSMGVEQRTQLAKGGSKELEERYALQEEKVREAQKKVNGLRGQLQITDGVANGESPSPLMTADTVRKLENLGVERKADQPSQADVAPRKPATPTPVPQPEVQTADNAFSTFSLNVSDVSLKLAAASLEKGVMPEPATVRSEEFINAFEYRDPEPSPGVPVAFAWDRARYPFAQNRDLLRFSIKTAALGRQPGRPLNLVLLLDNSGSMERADRVQIIGEALRVLAGQLQPQDKFSIVTFSRTAHLWVDGVPGNQAAKVAEEVGGLSPQGGTNLEEAMNLAYQTALRHYLANGVNRVVLLTDGAANLGNVDPEALKQKVEANRKQGIALDCFGIGWEGYNDDLLEVLSRNGDGRYGFVNTPEEAATEFAGQLAGALQVAASDVKVQVEFNPARVTAYRQIGYAKHQLTKEQFRDNTVDAAEIGAAESGNALYVVEVNPRGNGPLAIVRVRFKVPGTTDYREHEWPVPYTGNAVALEQASPALRLAATASAFSEWLVSSPYAAEVTPDRLLGYLSGVPEVYGADARPKKLEWMIRQAKSIAGK